MVTILRIHQPLCRAVNVMILTTTTKRNLSTYIFGVLAAVFVLSGAARGHDGYPEDRGEKFFSKNELELIEIAKLVSQCAGDGLLSIYPDGHVLRSVDGTVRCPSTKISTRMRLLGVLWINASGDRPYGQHGPFATTFVLSSRGIIGAGHGSAIYYFPNPEKYPFKDSVALKGVPGHWFFRQY